MSEAQEVGAMKVIAIEEHFITPLYREKVGANEFRNFYLKSRGEQLGHDIVAQNSDLGAERLAHMDAAGVDVQVLSFGSPGPQAFGAEVAIPMARDANDRLYQAIQKNPGRFAGFAALPTADPEAAAQELERCVSKLGFKGAMIHGHTRGSFSRRAQVLDDLRARAGARRADLSAPDAAAPGRREGLLRGLRGAGARRLGLRGGH